MMQSTASETAWGAGVQDRCSQLGGQVLPAHRAVGEAGDMMGCEDRVWWRRRHRNWLLGVRAMRLGASFRPSLLSPGPRGWPHLGGDKDSRVCSSRGVIFLQNPA